MQEKIFQKLRVYLENFEREKIHLENFKKWRVQNLFFLSDNKKKTDFCWEKAKIFKKWGGAHLVNATPLDYYSFNQYYGMQFYPTIRSYRIWL